MSTIYGYRAVIALSSGNQIITPNDMTTAEIGAMSARRSASVAVMFSVLHALIPVDDAKWIASGPIVRVLCQTCFFFFLCVFRSLR